MKRDSELFFKYLVIGAIATIIDFFVLYSLTEFLGVWYFYSAGIAYGCAIIPHYTLNKYWNFKNKSRRVFSQFGLFVLFSLIGLVFNQIILFGLVEFFGLWYIFAKLIAVLIVLIYNFLINKKVTFGALK